MTRTLDKYLGRDLVKSTGLATLGMEATLGVGRAGNGRVGGDYWKIGARFVGSGRISSGNSGGSRGTLFGIYLKSAVGQVGFGELVLPGRDT